MPDSALTRYAARQHAGTGWWDTPLSEGASDRLQVNQHLSPLNRLATRQGVERRQLFQEEPGYDEGDYNAFREWQGENPDGTPEDFLRIQRYYADHPEELGHPMPDQGRR